MDLTPQSAHLAQSVDGRDSPREFGMASGLRRAACSRKYPGKWRNDSNWGECRRPEERTEHRLERSPNLNLPHSRWRMNLRFA